MDNTIIRTPQCRETSWSQSPRTTNQVIRISPIKLRINIIELLKRKKLRRKHLRKRGVQSLKNLVANHKRNQTSQTSSESNQDGLKRQDQH